MSDPNQSKETKEAGRLPPVSAFDDPISQLLRIRILDPPSRPGLLACLGRYEIYRVTGIGGMGLVCQGFDSGSPATLTASTPAVSGAAPSAGGDLATREVAIKILRPEFVANAKAVELFLREARTMRDLSHPHILPVLEVSQSAGHRMTAGNRPQRPPAGKSMTVLKGERPYFVMPFIEGGSLAALIRNRGPLTSELALRLAIQVASALVHVHEKGLIHRDLNPNNVLLASGPTALVADFGLSRTILNDPTVDVTRPQTAGTKPYMSPGIVAGEAEDTRCDIYSFGALLYEMITGSAPYHESSHIDLERCILAGPPKSARILNPKAEPGLVAIAEAAMARRLKDRYARMADVLSDLRRVEQGLPIQGPFSTPEPGSRQDDPKVTSALSSKRLVRLATAFLGGVAVLVSLAWMGLHGSLKQVVRLELPGVHNWSQARLVDWEGDGYKEIVFLAGSDLTVIDRDGVLLRQQHPVGLKAAGLQLDLVLDAPPGSSCRCFFHWEEEESAIVAELDNQLRSLRRFSVPKKDLPPGAELKTVAVWQASDGSVMLLATASSPESSRVFCYQNADPNPKWSRSIRGEVVDSALVVWDKVSDPEVVCTINATRASSGSEDTTRVQAWQGDGNDRWSVALPHTGARPRIATAVGNGSLLAELLVWTEEDPWLLGNTNHIRRIKRDGKADVVFTLPVGLGDFRILPTRPDPSYLATDRNGSMYLLDESLRLVRQAHVVDRLADTAPLRISTVDDLNAGGGRRIVIVAAQVKVLEPGLADQPPAWASLTSEVLVVGEDLRPRARMVVSETKRVPGFVSALVTDWQAEGVHDILTFGSQARVLEYKPPFLERFQGGR